MYWLSLYFSVEQYTGFISGDMNVIVYSTGNVTFAPTRTTKSACHFNEASLYSNNLVNCTLKFMSWTHSSNSLNLLPESIALQIHQFLSPNNYWQIEVSEVTRQELPFEDEIYLELDYNLHIKRVG